MPGIGYQIPHSWLILSNISVSFSYSELPLLWFSALYQSRRLFTAGPYAYDWLYSKNIWHRQASYSHYFILTEVSWTAAYATLKRWFRKKKKGRFFFSWELQIVPTTNTLTLDLTIYSNANLSSGMYKSYIFLHLFHHWDKLRLWP